MRTLASFCYRRRGSVTIVWIAALVGLAAFAAVAGGATMTDFQLPGSESREATDILAEHGFAQSRHPPALAFY